MSGLVNKHMILLTRNPEETKTHWCALLAKYYSVCVCVYGRGGGGVVKRRTVVESVELGHTQKGRFPPETFHTKLMPYTKDHKLIEFFSCEKIKRNLTTKFDNILSSTNIWGIWKSKPWTENFVIKRDRSQACTSRIICLDVWRAKLYRPMFFFRTWRNLVKPGSDSMNTL